METFNNEYSTHTGLDWADTKHDICLKVTGEQTVEYATIHHTPEAIEEWALSLQKRLNNQPVAICLELKAGPIVYALLKYAFITLFPVPPGRWPSIVKHSPRAVQRMTPAMPSCSLTICCVIRSH